MHDNPPKEEEESKPAEETKNQDVEMESVNGAAGGFKTGLQDDSSDDDNVNLIQTNSHNYKYNPATTKKKVSPNANRH